VSVVAELEAFLVDMIEFSDEVCARPSTSPEHRLLLMAERNGLSAALRRLQALAAGAVR